MKICILSLVFLLTFHTPLFGADGTLTLIQNAGAGSQNLGDHSHEEEGKEKDKMQMLQALMQAAQAAAAIAAAAGNKKTADKVTASEPVKVPEIPGISPPPAEKTEEAKLPELAAESPAPEVSIEPEPATTSGVVALSTPAPLPSEAPVATQVFTENPQSDIPDTIPNDRAKLGYDERNPTGGSPTPAAPGTPNSNPLSSGSLASGSMGTATVPASLKPEGTEKKDRFVDNQTAPESSDGGGDSGGGSGYGSASGGGSGDDKGDGSNMMDMIQQMMGGGAAGATAAAGPSGQHGDAMYSGAGGGGGKSASGAGQRETIFEYASFRYRKMAFEEKIIKRDGRKKPAVAGVLSQAHDLFSNVAQ